MFSKLSLLSPFSRNTTNGSSIMKSQLNLNMRPYKRLCVVLQQSVPSVKLKPNVSVSSMKNIFGRRNSKDLNRSVTARSSMSSISSARQSVKPSSFVKLKKRSFASLRRNWTPLR